MAKVTFEASKSSNIFRALLKAQASLSAVKKSGTSAAHGNKVLRYATLADILSLVRPALNSHNIVLTQSSNYDADTGLVEVFTQLVWVGEGESAIETVETSTTIAVERSSKNFAHALASAITYGSRYGLASLLGIECVDDDDGNAAGEKSDSKKYGEAQQQQRSEARAQASKQASAGSSSEEELSEEFKQYVHATTDVAVLREDYKSCTAKQQQYIVEQIALRKQTKAQS